MATLGSFGITSPGTDNIISRNTNQSAEVAVLANAEGQKLEGTTYGSEKRISEEIFTPPTLPTQEAVDAQNGASLVLSDAIAESNTDYAKQTKETVEYPGGTV